MVQRVQPGGVAWINRRSPDGRQRIKPAGLGAVLLPASGRARLAGYAGMRTKLPTQARYGAGMSLGLGRRTRSGAVYRIVLMRIKGRAGEGGYPRLGQPSPSVLAESGRLLPPPGAVRRSPSPEWGVAMRGGGWLPFVSALLKFD